MDEELFYCSSCGKEINANDKVCKNCGAVLDEIIDEGDMDVETAAVFYSDVEAEIAKERLEEADIECYLSGSSDGSMRPSLAFSQGINLMVMKKDLEKAVEYLKGLNIIE